jgi:outer membrane protein OmpA-like peptidoglycan-associated protein
MRASTYIVLFASILIGTPAFAQDVEGAKDHPLVGRYEGATAVFYKQSDFDEAALLQAPHDYNALLERNATKDRSGKDWLKLEGRVTQIRYEGPEGRSSLEILRNFQSALKGEGFETVFSCSDADCLAGKLRDNYLIGEQVDPGNGNTGAYQDHARYLLAKLDQDKGPVYAAILVSEAGGATTTFVEVVETKGMEGDKIAVPSSDDMHAAIQNEGSVNVYGILFDFDQDSLKPESKETLDQIALLMEGDPNLKLEIVGHTDNRGGAEYNMDLSRRRAANVVDALVTEYKISADRLSSSGAGSTMPVASNATEEGRARNRRVELKAQ